MEPGDSPLSRNVDFDLLRHCEEEQARVIHSPFDVRHRELTRGGQRVSDQPPLNLGNDFVSRTVNCQNSVQLCLKLTVLLQFADRVSRRENNLRILLSLENALSHILVTLADAGVTTARIDDDGAAGFSGGEIGSDCSVREFEFSVRGMERARQTKLDQGLRRIELKGSRQRLSRYRPVRESQDDKNDCERARSR